MKKTRYLFLSLLGVMLVMSSCQKHDIPSTSISPISTSSIDPSTSGSTSESTSVTPSVLVESITFDKSEYDVKMKSSLLMTVNVLPSDATNKNLTFTTSDESIVSVSSRGLLYGWKEGTATVTATAKDGSGVTQSAIVHVSKIPVTGLTLSVESLTMEVDDEEKVKVTITPSDASIKDITASIVQDEEYVSVSASSLTVTVKALKVGNATLVIKSEDNPLIYAECPIVVQPTYLEGIYMSKSRCYLNVDDTFIANVNYMPANATNKNVSWETSNPSVATVNNGLVTAISVGSAVITATSEEGGFEASMTVDVSPKGEVIKKSLRYTQKDLANNNLYGLDTCPSIGSPKALVVPVWFTNSSSFIDPNCKNNIKEDIEIAYSGSNSQTGWRSVRTYYEDDSYNNLHLQPIVSDWYECGQKYDNFLTNSYATTNLVESAVKWYKSTYHLDDMKDFDLDQNGLIDSVILIYAAPDYRSWGKSESTAGNLWAYCSWILNKPNLANPEPNVFFWASYDFMYDETIASSRTGKANFGGGDCSNGVNIDSHTFIHEFGHILGLDDYYDYAGYYSPAASFSMQDYNVGMHDPFSKLTLGWTDPYVISESTTLSINKLTTSGDCIIVTNEESGSPFDEYILIEMYSPDGLNEHDVTYPYNGHYPQGPNGTGIRLWHVDGRLLYAKGSSSYYIKEDQITTNPYIDGYKTFPATCNTSDGSRDLIQSFKSLNQLYMIRNDKTITYQTGRRLTSDDLFVAGDSFDMYDFYQQFPKKQNNMGLLDSGEAFPFTIRINSVGEESASITITKN